MTPPPSRPSLLAVLTLSLLSACSSLGGASGKGRLAEMGRDEALARIAELEDTRSEGHGQLTGLAGHLDPWVRARAMTALGRLPLLAFGNEVTAVLASGLSDPNADVRARAAFALGMRADPESSEALSAALADTDDGVRAAVVEAASKVGTPELRGAVLEHLNDPSLGVRIEAAVGPHRWPTGEDPMAAAEVDAALVAVAAKAVRPEGVDQPTGAFESAEVLWRVLFSLQRRGPSVARGVFLNQARCESEVLVRLHAVKGLVGLARTGEDGPDEDVRRELAHALLDPDWRVVVEALGGLGSSDDPRTLDAIERSLAHPVPHVRAAAFEALGHHSPSDRIARLLEGARVDRSATVRASAFEAEARIRGPILAPDIELKMASKDPLMRAACARAAARLPSELATPYLTELSRDSNLRVAGLAIEGLGEHPTPSSRDRLHDILLGRDNGRRLAALLALRASPDADDLPAVRRTFERARGDISAELKFNCLRYAEELATDDAFAFVRSAQADDHPYVRQVAYEILRDADRSPGPVPDLTWPAPDLPRRGAELPAENPLVEISTGRGRMTFELFADEAPVHVANFLELAERDHYDGLTFHRVVPDFVIQGGCYRGDGNGASPWRGQSLRHEIGPRKYTRGSLGMPRNDDMESGGSQFFVTHRPTPHLDGRYTIFGELRSGEAVLDQIEVGEIILDVRVLDPLPE